LSTGLLHYDVGKAVVEGRRPSPMLAGVFADRGVSVRADFDWRQERRDWLGLPSVGMVKAARWKAGAARA
jgi:hypothetical protein